MAAYARQAKDTELVQYATEIKVRAERRCGELLANTERAKPTDNLKRGPKSNDATTGPTLSDIGLTRDESSRYQQLAAMPDEHFETAVDALSAQPAPRALASITPRFAASVSVGASANTASRTAAGVFAEKWIG